MIYSIAHPQNTCSLKKALFFPLPKDGSLYMSRSMAALSAKEISRLRQASKSSYLELLVELSRILLAGACSEEFFHSLAQKMPLFEPKIQSFHDNFAILELFHGPSLSFKDFGACFLAQLIGYFLKKEGLDKKFCILVASSGDTGSAVAQAFYKHPFVQVCILYPKNMVSPFQERQMACLGENIHALQVDGSFDDCQSMVKQAFLDEDLEKRMQLSSANSINIARLYAQIVYYFYAAFQMQDLIAQKSLICSVPSGNVGNLCAGLCAKQMGAKIDFFLAGTNCNDALVRYMHTGKFEAKKTKATLSNSMDVGSPSNFARLLDIYGPSSENLAQDLYAASFTDEQTVAAMQELWQKRAYLSEPHGAIAYLAAQKHFEEKGKQDFFYLCLATAHPGKFQETVEAALGEKISLASTLENLQSHPKYSVSISSYGEFKSYLINNI